MTKVLSSLLVLLFVTFVFSYGFEDFDALVEEKSLYFSGEENALGYDSSFILNIQEDLFAKDPFTPQDQGNLPTNVEDLNALSDKLVQEALQTNAFGQSTIDLKKIQLPLTNTQAAPLTTNPVPQTQVVAPTTPVVTPKTPVDTPSVSPPRDIQKRAHREMNPLQAA